MTLPDRGAAGPEARYQGRMTPCCGQISRRRLIAGTGLAAAAALLAGPARSQPADGFRLLRARPGDVRLRGPERGTTSIWGFEGVAPGPVLRVKRGEELKVRFLNELPANATVHWHGVRVPNGMDGVPPLTQKPVVPGGSFDYRFTPPDAGTFWYHSAFRAPGAEHGLHGLLIVDEAEPVDVDRDVALVLDAWPHAGDGALPGDGKPNFTANGAPSLDIPVNANERVRLRLLNAAPDRFMTLRVDRHPVTVMAIDGQPAEPFVARDSRITLSPGNRADLFFDAILTPGSVAPLVLKQDGADVPIGRLVYGKAATRPAARSELKPLPPNPLPERMDFRGALRHELALDGGPRDKTAFGPALFSARRGRTVMLALANRTDAPQVVHLHGHHARLLDNLDDGWKPFWLDTILCVPKQTTRIAFVADNPGRWALTARTIDGETALASVFEVT